MITQALEFKSPLRDFLVNNKINSNQTWFDWAIELDDLFAKAKRKYVSKLWTGRLAFFFVIIAIFKDLFE